MKTPHLAFSALFLYLCTGGRGNFLAPIAANSLFVIAKLCRNQTRRLFFQRIELKKGSSSCFKPDHRGPPTRMAKITVRSKAHHFNPKKLYFIQNPFKITSYFILLLKITLKQIEINLSGIFWIFSISGKIRFLGGRGSIFATVTTKTKIEISY